MNAFDRDTELERRQIHEISVNVARRLLDVLNRRHEAPHAVAEDIVAGARVIADIQRDIDGIMTALPHGETLDLAVLTHVLASHNRALSLVEDLEIKAGGRGAERRTDPEHTHAALIATAREIEAEARRYDPDPAPQTLRAPRPDAAGYPPPQSAPRTAANGPSFAAPANRALPAGHGTARPPSRPPTADPAPATRPPPHARPQPHHWQPPQQKKQPPPPPAQTAARRRTSLRALAFSPMGAVALVAGIAIVAASLAGAVSFALSNGDASHESPMAARAPDGKFNGRLSAGDAAPAGGSDILVVTPPPNAAPLAQPYLVVLATRRSTEELDQDFRFFKDAHPTLLGDARGRVDTVQSQDGKTWHRLSLIPPRSQEEAAALCTELKAAGLTECWIKPLPFGRDAAR